MDIKPIIEGVVNTIFSNEEIEALAKGRKAICMSCEFLSKSKERCTVCGCIITFKVRQNRSRCPKQKW